MGKGDKYRPVDKKRYDDNFSKIKWGTSTWSKKRDKALNEGFHKQQQEEQCQ